MLFFFFDFTTQKKVITNIQTFQAKQKGFIVCKHNTSTLNTTISGVLKLPLSVDETYNRQYLSDGCSH